MFFRKKKSIKKQLTEIDIGKMTNEEKLAEIKRLEQNIKRLDSERNYTMKMRKLGLFFWLCLFIAYMLGNIIGHSKNWYVIIPALLTFSIGAVVVSSWLERRSMMEYFTNKIQEESGVAAFAEKKMVKTIYRLKRSLKHVQYYCAQYKTKWWPFWKTINRDPVSFNEATELCRAHNSRCINLNEDFKPV